MPRVRVIAPRRRLKCLVACEYSGTVRDALIRRGHDAISCDLLPTESPGPHIVGDVLPLLGERWDFVVAHPPCTYLCNSGVRWLHTEAGRWALMRDSAAFFAAFRDANADYVVAENPVMHGYARDLIGTRPDQTCQPWQFGDPFKKRTCWWVLRGSLPKLVSTVALDALDAARDAARGAVHFESPGPDRWKRRSTCYPGMADALADQWGRYVAERIAA